MAKINLALPRIDQETLTDTQAIRRIQSYLYQLNEQLRYELTHIDEDNMAGDGLSAAAISPTAIKQLIENALANHRIDISDNDVILSINNRINNLARLEALDAQNISANTAAIATRAAKSTVDALTLRVDGHDTAISGILSALTEKASAAALDTLSGQVTALSSTVSGHTSDISALNTALAGKVSTGDFTSLSGRVGTIEGTDVIRNSASIAAVAGKFTVDSNGNVHVIDGSGLYLDEGQASYGVYTSGSLTGGIIVEKLNDNSTVTQILGDRVNVRATDLAAWGVYTNDTLTAGIIVDKINGGTVSINGSKVVIEGETLVNKISGLSADFVNLTSGNTTVTGLAAQAGGFNNLYAYNSFSLDGKNASWGLLSMGSVVSNTWFLGVGGSNINLDHYHDIAITENNGVVTFTPGAVTDTSTPRSFNIADTQFYKDAVASAANAVTLSGSWSSGTYTVTASNGKTASTELSEITTNGTPEAYNTWWIKVLCKTVTTDNVTVITDRIDVNAKDIYDAGAASVSQRSASSLSNLTLFASHTGTASRNVRVNYDTGDYVSLPIQIDASAVYAAGQNSVTPRTVSSLSKITLSSSEIGSNVSKTTTAQFSSGSDQSGIAISVDASAVYNQGNADGWAVGVDAKTPVSLEVTSSTSVSVGGSSIIVSNIKAKGNMGTFYDTDGLSLDINSKFSRIGTARGGLSNYGYAKLYRENLGSYIPVGEHYWYYSDSNQNLRTLLEPV